MVSCRYRNGISALIVKFNGQIFRLHLVVTVVFFPFLIGNNARKSPLLRHEFDVQHRPRVHVERVRLFSVQTVVLHRKRRVRLIGNTHRRTIMSRRPDTSERTNRDQNDQKCQNDLFHNKKPPAFSPLIVSYSSAFVNSTIGTYATSFVLHKKSGKTLSFFRLL